MQKSMILNEKSLVNGLKNHDEHCFRTLFEFYKNEIYAYSLSILKSKDFAEENVQDTFLKIWLNRDSLNTEQSFKAYLFTIARNQAFNILAKAANDAILKEQIFYSSQKSYDQSDYLLRELECHKLKKEAIKQLPKERRKIFKLSRNKGKTYEEISQELGISIHTVRNQMSKALETMRAFLRANDTMLPILLLCVHFFLQTIFL